MRAFCRQCRQAYRFLNPPRSSLGSWRQLAEDIAVFMINIPVAFYLLAALLVLYVLVVRWDRAGRGLRRRDRSAVRCIGRSHGSKDDRSS